MKKETFAFSGFEGTVLPAVLWLPEGEVLSVLQITHGMTEHMGRYESLAGFLTDRGIAVAGFDLRGHGKNPGGRIAAFARYDWQRTIQDMNDFHRLLSNRFPGIPCFLHGFSLGSFLVRDYLGRYPQDMAGALILGTGNQSQWLLGIMKAIVKTQVRKAGWEQGSPLVRQLSFGAYNQKFKPNRTHVDWLCADEAQLNDYLADPLCREEISTGLFYQMLEAMEWTGKGSSIQTWNKSMPVLLLCGADDPVGNMGRGAEAVKKQLDQEGIDRVFLHLMPGARHMVLCEAVSGTAIKSLQIISEFIESNR